MNYVLQKMKLKGGKRDKVESFLNTLSNSHLEELTDNASKAGLLIDSYFLDNEYLYVFKKQGEGHLHLSLEELNNNKFLKMIIDWTEECVEKTELVMPVFTVDLQSKND